MSQAPALPAAVWGVLSGRSSADDLLAVAAAGDGRVVAARAMKASECFTVTFAVEGTKAKLSSAPGLLASELQSSSHLWSVLRAKPASSKSSGDTIWQVEPEILRSVRHAPLAAPSSASALAANVRIYSQQASVSDGGAAAGSFVAVYVTRDIAEGEELLRDYLEPAGVNSVSKAAMALELLPVERWADSTLRSQLEQAVGAAVDAAAASSASKGASSAPPPRPRGSGKDGVPPFVPQQPVALFTNYPTLAKHARRPGFEVVTDSSGRDLSALWLVTPFKQWRDLPVGLLVNQFPYEGCLVQKDLLLNTVQRIHGHDSADTNKGLFPPWCPVTFDLATQAHLLADYHKREAQRTGKSPTWIVKLASGTHSADPCITDDLTCVMRYATSAPGGDRIAQRYESSPMLICGGRKFDMRIYVAVKDFLPLEAAVHCGYYGRVAALPYSSDSRPSSDATSSASPSSKIGGDDDNYSNFSRHYTVSWYGDGPQSTLLNAPALTAAAEAEGVDWTNDVHPRIVDVLQQLFAGAGRHFIGHWPYSRGLYGVDVLLAWRDGANDGSSTRTLQPLVLEVNFAGDLQTILERVPPPHASAPEPASTISDGSSNNGGGGGSGAGNGGTFVDQVLTYLFTDEQPLPPRGWEAL